MCAAPLPPCAVVIDRSASLSQDKRIYVSVNRQRALGRAVRRERAEVFKLVLGGVELDCTQGTMQQLADEMNFQSSQSKS